MKTTLSIIAHAPDIHEYRVQAVARTPWVSLSALLASVLLASFVGPSTRVFLAIFVLYASWKIVFCVIHESVFALVPHGVQVETHYGIPKTTITPSVTLSVTRRFIPLSAIMDIVLNEGIRGWNFRYYLALICRSTEKTQEPVRIHVAFENTLPYASVLKQVYLGLRETFFCDESIEIKRDDSPADRGPASNLYR